MVVQQVTRTELFETIPLIPLATYDPGVIEKKLFSQGNSILSTLFVKQSDPGGSVSVEWRESTTGEDEGEDLLLDSHTTPADGQSNKIIVTRVHNKPRLVATVTGAPVRFGVYITVISAFASDLDNALVMDNQVADLAVALGLQTAIYDPVQNKFFFARGSGGIQQVAVDSKPAKVLKSADGVQTTPGAMLQLINQTVPAGKVWKLYNASVATRVYSELFIEVDGIVVGKFLSSAAESTPRYPIVPYLEIPAGKVVKLSQFQTSGPVSNVQGFIHLTEESV